MFLLIAVGCHVGILGMMNISTKLQTSYSLQLTNSEASGVKPAVCYSSWLRRGLRTLTNLFVQRLKNSTILVLF